MVRGGVALPVEGLARRVADRVDHALLAHHLQVAVHGGEADGLALAAQLGVDLLSAAEAGQAGKRGGHGRRLLRAPHPGTARMIQCHILQVSRPSFPWPWTPSERTSPGSAFLLLTDNRNDYH